MDSNTNLLNEYLQRALQICEDMILLPPNSDTDFTIKLSNSVLPSLFEVRTYVDSDLIYSSELILILRKTLSIIMNISEHYPEIIPLLSATKCIEEEIQRITMYPRNI